MPEGAEESDNSDFEITQGGAEQGFLPPGDDDRTIPIKSGDSREYPNLFYGRGQSSDADALHTFDGRARNSRPPNAGAWNGGPPPNVARCRQIRAPSMSGHATSHLGVAEGERSGTHAVATPPTRHSARESRRIHLLERLLIRRRPGDSECPRLCRKPSLPRP